MTANEGRVPIREAASGDAERIGWLLDNFNREFVAPTPGADVLAERIRRLLGGTETVVLLAGEPPDGLAVVRFRPALWDEGLESYLAELYVSPARRGRGTGRALMNAALAVARARGATSMELGTSEADRIARALYESLGFTNREGGADGPVNYFYTKEL